MPNLTDPQSKNPELDKTTKSVSDLNQLYKDAEAIDKDVFSEMRTNILLVAGNHYEKSQYKYWNRIRDSRSVSADQKIRLTKNHIGRIARIYQNSILSNNPDVTVTAKQEKEIQCQKAAELQSSVLDYIKSKHHFYRKKSLWAKDYIEIGEVFVKIFWDPNAGSQIGWHPSVDEIGDPIIDPNNGQPVPSDEPVMSGDLVFETVHGFDLLRDPAVKNMDDATYVVIRKMESVKELKKKFAGDEAKLKFITESSTDTFKVFQASGGYYAAVKGMTMVREYYFKPSLTYPNGYYYIATEDGILSEGELPFGIFPIVHVAFDELTTNPRGRSIVRQLRPYQIEINRSFSMMAQTQITVGMDQVWYQAGSKPSGDNSGGIRARTYVGSPPIVVPGRAGDQFLEYANSQIAEMYQVADVAELDKEINGQLDPYTLLFRSIRQKQKFSFYGEKFEHFIVKIFEIALTLYQKYCSPMLAISSLGKNEQVNIPEFKSSSPLLTRIKIDPQSDDLETKMGKQLTLNHILQYVGPQLDKKDIGRFLRLSPYLNTEKMFQDMTQDYDNAVNDILQLDRGEYPPTQPYEDSDYAVKMLVSRMKQPDFRYMPPNVQQAYNQKMQEHQQSIAQKAQVIKQAQSEFIPSGGYQVVCDLYVPDPNNPGKTQRVKIPSESISWLLKQLESQGSTQDQLQQLGNQQVQAQIASLLSRMPVHPSPAVPAPGIS